MIQREAGIFPRDTANPVAPPRPHGVRFACAICRSVTFLYFLSDDGCFGLMGRPKRAADGGLVYHLLNRSHARMPILEQEGDYQAFKQLLQEAVERHDTRWLADYLMGNQWH